VNATWYLTWVFGFWATKSLSICILGRSGSSTRQGHDPTSRASRLDISPCRRRWDIFSSFYGSNWGILCKVIPLFGLDKIVKHVQKAIDLRTYDDGENLA